VIVVDTGVWIDHLRDRSTSAVTSFLRLIDTDTEIAVTGVIRMELLRGARACEYVQLSEALDAFTLLDTQACDYDAAATLFRAARGAGVAVRNSIDYLIAAPCIRTGTPLLHSDADFDKLAAVSDLRIVS